MPELATTPKPSAPATTRGLVFRSAPDGQRDYQKMMWDEMEDNEFVPFDNLEFIIDPNSGRVRMVDCQYSREDDRRLRRVVKGSISFPRSWPLGFSLSAEQIKSICKRSWERGISLVEAFVQAIGKNQFSPDFLKRLTKTNPTYWRPRDENEPATFTNERRTGSSVYTGMMFPDEVTQG